LADNPLTELEEFLRFLYEDEQGLVYCPVKNPVSDKWEECFFSWPDQLDQILNHVIERTDKEEVYIGPALYNNRKAIKPNVKGSRVVWTEYDGNSTVQSHNDNIPPPSYRIQSSILGHEHFYWKLDRFETNISTIEGINRAITYTTSADASAWDITQILRPPATINHKHEKPVLSLVKSEYIYNVQLFSQLEVPPITSFTIDESNLPDPMSLVAKYPWKDGDFEHFRSRSVSFGVRSSSLMRLGYICAEMRMSDIECYTVLANADARWGKFVGRNDRQQRIFDIISKARLKYPLITSFQSDIEIYDFETILETEVHLEWIIEGVLQRAGHVLVSGPPAVGKTQFSLRCAMCMAIGKPFLHWNAGAPQKILFISMEMGITDLKFFLSQMAVGLDEAERKLLRENFLLAPLGYGIPIDSKEGQAQINHLIEKHSPNGIFFDSLGISTEGELGEVTAKAITAYTSKIREDNDLFVWFIHHNRKAQVANKKPNKLSDIYGSVYITAAPTTVIGLWPTGRDQIEVSGLKVRMYKEFDSFIIERDTNLDFRVTDDAPLGMLSSLVKAQRNSEETYADEGPEPVSDGGSAARSVFEGDD
jgi:AAA domain